MKNILILIVLFGCCQNPMPDLEADYFQGNWQSESLRMTFVSDYLVIDSLNIDADYSSHRWVTAGPRIVIDGSLYDLTPVNEKQFIFEEELYYKE